MPQAGGWLPVRRRAAQASVDGAWWRWRPSRAIFSNAERGILTFLKICDGRRGASLAPFPELKGSPKSAKSALSSYLRFGDSRRKFLTELDRFSKFFPFRVYFPTRV